MSLDKIMSTELVTVQMDDSLEKVKEIFEERAFHHVLVVDDGRLDGVVSDRDLFKALSPNIGTRAETSKDAASLQKKVHMIMTRKVITLGTGASIADAVEVFNRNNISCIPVVDDNNYPVGIISWRDILKITRVEHVKHQA